MPSDNSSSRHIVDGQPPPLPITRRGVTPEGSNDVLAALAPSTTRKREYPSALTSSTAHATTYTTRAPGGWSGLDPAFWTTDPWAGASLQPYSSFDNRLSSGGPAPLDYLYTRNPQEYPNPTSFNAPRPRLPSPGWVDLPLEERLSPSPGHKRRRIEQDDAAPKRQNTGGERPSTMREVTRASGQTSVLTTAPISDRPPIQRSSPSVSFATSRAPTPLRLPPGPGQETPFPRGPRTWVAPYPWTFIR